MKKVALAVLSITPLMISCAITPDNNRSAAVSDTATQVLHDKGVPYEIARGYFLKNTARVDRPTLIKITSPEKLDEMFGMATVMGDGGKPTEIDFSTEYAIAVVYPETDRSTALSPQHLTRDSSGIRFSYTLHEGEKQTYQTQPMLMIVVGKEYQGELEFTADTLPFR